MVLLDTPGLLEPEYALHGVMRAVARQALRDADVVVYLADATQGPPPPLADLVPEATWLAGKRILLALNKSDLLDADARAALLAQRPEAVLLSAASGDGIDELEAAIAEALPEGEFLYPEDELSVQPLRFFVAELLRETALEQLGDEVPYAVACEIEEFREDRTPLYIRAVLHVERESQKRILIGAQGARIRALGTAARAKVERLVGQPVYLDLWVKVTPKWRRNPAALARLGYRMPDEPR
jgi:GTP-binding protein Era